MVDVKRGTGLQVTVHMLGLCPVSCRDNTLLTNGLTVQGAVAAAMQFVIPEIA